MKQTSKHNSTQQNAWYMYTLVYYRIANQQKALNQNGQ